MLKIYTASQGGLQSKRATDSQISDAAIWLDLHVPDDNETAAVEHFLGIDVPTREEMQEIEISSRVYSEDGAVFLTTMVLAQSDTERPSLTPITFILAGERLVTLRYTDPRSFRAFSARALRPGSGYHSGLLVLFGLLEAVIDRAADILETIGMDIDAISLDVFQPVSSGGGDVDYQAILAKVGREGDLTSKARESLVSIGRIITFIIQAAQDRKWTRDTRARLKTMSRDVQSLTDHASFLSGKIAFLLDATLGMISIQQNAIIKIFSVAAVVFLPPTLVASIYGMNFVHMPELEWATGYPMAILLMLLSAFLAYWFFKRRGWL
ncbi:MAG: magnesium/cobalt transporter CorA [Wenzhouxiangellaceae bacterium]